MSRITKQPRYSQNFLINQGVCRRIIELAALMPDDRVVEIGPGRGALTALLLERAYELWLIEIDPALIEPLRARFGPRDRLHLMQADALRFPFEQIPAPFKVVANLPYAVASPLLIRLLELRGAISFMVLMFQREVAERLTAAPGSRRYGLLSILAQLYADVALQMIVSPGSFRPPPKVESAVVTVTPRPRPRVAIEDETVFLRLVRQGFALRRKTLGRSLRHLSGISMTAERAAALLREAGIDPMRRPETLSIEEWARLSRVIAPKIQ
ncbi:MAG: 16S rRNA (adenine(1518)-N(6)/adenine(1519)-N(6))-dimethyltransferase RsmA [Nitrospirota bacterium]